MILNCVIIDDNPNHRLASLKIINAHPSLNLVGEFKTPIEAKHFLLTNSVNLIIMDVLFSLNYSTFTSLIQTQQLRV